MKRKDYRIVILRIEGPSLKRLGVIQDWLGDAMSDWKKSKEKSMKSVDWWFETEV